MSVIVNGVEMPKDCDSCWLPERICNLWLATDLNKRHSGCPLRPLPEKHGRLGDLDELQSSLRESVDECKKWIKELEKIGDNETLALANQAFCTFVEAALRLKSIPTIVEAEGE